MTEGANLFILTSDEAILSLNSEVNTENAVKYSKYGEGHPPDHYIGHQQGAAQVMVWVGLTVDGRVLGPHFIDGNMDSREYIGIVRYNVVQREFSPLRINPEENVWWQQDGAPAHRSNQSKHYYTFASSWPRQFTYHATANTHDCHGKT